MKNWKKTFAIIWSGQALSLLTSAIVSFSVIWWITVESGSAWVLALSSIAWMMPQAILGPFIGVWVDRWDRKKIMIYSDSFIALCSVALAVLFYFDGVAMWNIYIFLALRSLGNSFHFPAMQASMPLLAPEDQLGRVAGINQGLQSMANIAGPVLGAMCMAFLSMEFIMMLDLIGAVAAVTALFFVQIPRPEQHPDSKANSVVKDMVIAMKAILKDKGLSVLTGVWAFAMLIIIPVSIMFPIMVLKHFGGTVVQQGIVEALWGAGMLLGSVIVGIWGIKKGKVTTINLSYIAIGVATAVSGFLTPSQFYVFAGMSMVIGGIYPFLNGAFTVIMQTRVDPSMLGRAFALTGALASLPTPIGLIATGFVADSIGVGKAFIVGGATFLIIGVASFFLPALKRLQKES